MIKFGGQKCIMSSLNVVTTPWDKEYHISELQRLMPTDFCQQKAEMSRRVASLNLSLEEGVIFRALIITCPGMMPQIHALINVELLIGFICDRLPF